jgi:flagellar M-ring protein FliF
LNWFKEWPMGRKLAFGAGLGAIVLAMVAFGWWAYRTPQAVLFSDLAERDVAVMVGELDKLKQAYVLGPDGRSILVDSDKVHQTRMNLMGKQLPLHGVVGFELFNNADFGVSDFVQKVNYQRALQGELTRTILALEQVNDARVHLALPEQSVFKRDANKAKASVTLSLKAGQELQANQVAGIQRLIAASVPDVRVEDVTVLDQNGVVLSRATDAANEAAGAQLDAKQSMEAHLTKKLSNMLAQWFSPGEALVAVDVELLHQQSKVTKEEVLAAAQPGKQAVGVVVRQRSTTREPGAGGLKPDAEVTQLVSQETDYQVGRRTEQTVSPGGQVSRIQLAVVFKRAMTEAELVRLRQVLAAAVGLQPERGDVMAVHTLGDLTQGRIDATAHGPGADVASPPLAANAPATPTGRSPQAAGGAIQLWALAGLVVVALFVALLIAWRQWMRPPAPKPLTDTEREALLAAVQEWLKPHSKLA